MNSIIFLVTGLAAAYSAGASTLQPPSLPLIVRNPYLSVWLGNARGNPWEHWPIFWTGQEIGLSVLVSVPESKSVFPLFGRPQDSLDESSKSYKISYPDYVGATFDASTTNLTYNIPAIQAGEDGTTVILSFLSPITPTSTLRQSVPASYLSIYVAGSSHIDVYVDINGLWVTGNIESELVWEMNNISHTTNPTRSTHLKAWKVKRKIEEIFTENSDRSEWGTLYFSGPEDVKYEAGNSALLRQKFSQTGTLENLIDNRFRSVMQGEPVFAYSKSFNHNGMQNSKGFSYESLTFTIAHVQDSVVQYASNRGLTTMKPLWTSYYRTVNELIDFHYHDFVKVSGLAKSYSKQLEIDALDSGSSDYKDILELSARQVLGACSFAGNADNPVIFFKEISSDGNMNTVDVIYPAFPFFLYTNPKWLAWLMEPLIDYMLSGQYPNNYSMHDLGSSFPNATGHPDGRDEYMPVEECGNMLIMGLALVNSLRYESEPLNPWSTTTSNNNHIVSAQGILPLYVDSAGMDSSSGRLISISGEKAARNWIKRSYRLWKQWADYLVREALIPANQLSTDDFAGWLANQTNLALKGIIGIRAMAEISALVDEEEDASYFLKTSQDYVELWQNDYALSRDGTHVKLAYNWFGSWTTLYNLYADSVLCFHLSENDPSRVPLGQSQAPIVAEKSRTSRTAFVDENIYQIQNNWYQHVRQRYGLPLDSRHLYAKSDWELFAAAVGSRKLREGIIQSIALWINQTSTDLPLTDLYDTEGTGGYPGFVFKARPVVGGHFAYLALKKACGGQAVKALSFLDDAV